MSVLGGWARQVLSGPARRPGLSLVLGLSAGLYLASIFYGLPQELDADERLFFDSAVDLLQERTLDPGWYGPPAQPLIYLLAALIALIAVLGTVFGQFSSVMDVGPVFLEDVSLFYAAGRALNILFVLASIWLTDRILRRIGIDGHWRWIGLATLCLSPLWASYASIVRMDMMQICFMLASLQFCCEAAERRYCVRNLVLAGAFAGLAVTSKFPGIVSVVPIVLCAGLLAIDRVWTPVQAAIFLTLSGAACILAAFLSGPFLFLNFEGMLRDVLFEARGTHLGQTGAGFGAQTGFYLVQALPDAMSILAMILALAGLVIWLPRLPSGRLIACLACVYLVFIANLSLQWARWSLPLLPLMAIGLAAGGQGIEQLIARQVKMPMAGRVFVVACMAGIFPVLVAQTFPAAYARATNSDTRVQALAWAEETLPAGARILTETYAPALKTDLFDVYVPGGADGLQKWTDRSRRLRPNGYYGRLHEGWNGNAGGFLAALAGHDIDYVLISDSFLKRYRADAIEGPAALEIYDSLFETHEIVRIFRPSRSVLGPAIYVLQRKARPTGSAPSGEDT